MEPLDILFAPIVVTVLHLNIPHVSFGALAERPDAPEEARSTAAVKVELDYIIAWTTDKAHWAQVEGPKRVSGPCARESCFTRVIKKAQNDTNCKNMLNDPQGPKTNKNQCKRTKNRSKLKQTIAAVPRVWSRQPHDPEVAKHLVDDGQERLLFMTADVWVSPIDNDLCYSQQILGPTNSTVTKRNTAEPTRIIVVETVLGRHNESLLKVFLDGFIK
ncbi:hypothetical protein EXN66_Car021903 [Channa argus]|uniref:Uncharacterized protein n=1 Tax=Channa argus TaxID=215402 RepID=A0A6G1QU36_CHAAH|nr:hypothetical protein EXN66_Car021903 [Channa argus]